MTHPIPDRADERAADPAGATVRLADLTTLRLGGPARAVTEATDEAGIIAAVSDADRAAEPVLLVGGGSNLVVGDEGFPGRVVLLRSRGVTVAADLDGDRDGDTVQVTVAAGEPWDDFVAATVGNGWSGLECLSGIPGLVGATPVQNVGAYGAAVAETIRRVRVWDRDTGTVSELTPADCEFAYRASIFKHSERYVVLSVTFELDRRRESAPIAYAELAGVLGVPIGDRAPTSEVRDAVLELRRGKGMVLDATDHDTWSAGSFFTNPIVEPTALDVVRSRVGDGVRVPHWPDPGGVKLSAAWLIQHAGYGKGYGSGPATLSTKHTLALTNRGAASTADLLALATEIRAGVLARWGVQLQPEPKLVGVHLG